MHCTEDHTEVFPNYIKTHPCSCLKKPAVSNNNHSMDFPKATVLTIVPRSSSIDIKSCPATTQSSLNNSFSNSPTRSHSASSSPKKDERSETDLEQLREILERIANAKSPTTKRASISMLAQAITRLNE